jgi:hypothetical protein
MRRIEMGFLGVILLTLSFLGCSHSYPADRVKESIQEICRKEYGIENIEVKIVGSTVGVYLPIKKLFATDWKEAKDSWVNGKGKVMEVENLFRPSPEALDQVEDVLFSISRVLLSTDLKLQFYVLQATDVEKTGLQLILTGYVDDIKRVRLWDISRDEYRKRVLHELRLNRAVIWQQPIRAFFRELEKGSSLETLGAHFARPLPSEVFQSLFFVKPEKGKIPSAHWQLGGLHSTPLETTRVLVYVPLQIDYDPNAVAKGTFQVPSGTSLEYFFIVSFASEPPKIVRVIPLSFLDEGGRMQKIPMPGELDIEKDLKSWETEFSHSEIDLGDFLAEQLSRRAQALLLADERIQNTFESVQLTFRYRQEKAENYFSLDLDLKPKTPTSWDPLPSALDEDVLYLLNLASREFVEVLRSYRFSDYGFLQLKLASDPVSHIFAREQLELFRRNKINLQGLLGGVSPL